MLLCYILALPELLFLQASEACEETDSVKLGHLTQPPT